MTNEFEIVIASDDEHEKVFAEIVIDDKFVALVSYDHGIDKAVIEFPGLGFDESAIIRKTKLDVFRSALDAAIERLSGESNV